MPDATLSIKVVAGSSRNRIAGRYGEGLRVQVAAAPERGKANEAVVEVLAAALGIKPSQIEITSGHTQPRKRVRIIGMEQGRLESILAGF